MTRREEVDGLEVPCQDSPDPSTAGGGSGTYEPAPAPAHAGEPFERRLREGYERREAARLELEAATEALRRMGAEIRAMREEIELVIGTQNEA
jgi:hypothetical protein